MATSPDLTDVRPAGPAAADSDRPVVAAAQRGAFEVTLENFSGPFDLLLSLIAKHRLDVTEIALAQVTDEFIAHMRVPGAWDMSEASEFVVVAATLLDLKAARLLPRGDAEDEEDLELLESRDLLFARLLQYRAFRDVAADLAERAKARSRSQPRAVQLEPRYAALLPELVLRIGPDGLAALAAAALAPKPEPPGIDTSHLHAPVVSVREQAALLVDRLRGLRSASFRTLTADAASPAVVVSRFLALLELFREGAVGFEQAGPLGDLTIRWTGAVSGSVEVGAEYDDAAPGDDPTRGARVADLGDGDQEERG